MSACDSKTELVAIYRLEFYKKQKNWKLSTTRHKKCPEKQHKKHVEKNEKKPNLNTTYICVERGKEVSDQLNVAFVEAESENIQTQPNLSKNFQLSQEWLEPVNIWPPEIDGKNNNCAPNTNQYTSGEFLKHVENCPTCDDSGGTTPGRKNAMERVEELLKLQGYEEGQNNLNMMKETDWRDPEGYGCTGCDEEWPMRSALLLSAGHVATEIWGAEAEASVALDGECPDDPVYFGPWIQPSIRPGPPPGLEHAMEGSWDMSVDSFGEFSRGADAAPHSSEIDLTLPPPVDIADVSCARLSRLSSRQLLRAAELHSRVLRNLLVESERRQRLRECARDACGGEEPTRDPGPALPPPPSPGRDRGRGRGRLPRPELWG